MPLPNRYPLTYCPFCLGIAEEDGKKCVLCEGYGVVMPLHGEPYQWMREPAAVFEDEVCRIVAAENHRRMNETFFREGGC